MLDPATLCSVLAYAGLALAGVSAIWGTIQDFTVTDRFGHREIALGGKISIALTVIGLLACAGGMIGAQRLAGRAIARASDQEVRRTRELVLGAQPLRSLRLSWSFSDAPPLLLDPLRAARKALDEIPKEELDAEAAERHVSPEQAADALARERLLYPWLTAAAGGSLTTGDVVAILALDPAASVVLPFGTLSPGFARGDVPGGIEILRDPSVATPEGDTPPARPRAVVDLPELVLEVGRVSIEWRLPPQSLPLCMDRAEPTLSASAAFPETLRIVLLSNITSLPVDPANFTRPRWALPWSESGSPIQGLLAESWLSLSRNDVDAFPAEYAMRRIKMADAKAPAGSAETRGSEVTVWEGVRVWPE